jgi:hypothetical protein
MRFRLNTFSVVAAAALSAAGILAAPGSSFAADPAYCAQYARLALHETQANMATPGCFKGFDGRWHLDYQRHYSWCLTADVAAVNAERDYRRMRVYQCQGR